jgi:PiT family inorganic phosphate transporter
MDAHAITFYLVILVVVAALAFDYTNGFHDAANSIATVVSTRVLSPQIAVIWAAVFNFVAFLVFGTHVAKTVGGDMVDMSLLPEDFRLYVILAGLIGATTWNLITWWIGLPTSSSHAIVGGFSGAAVAAFGSIGILKAAGWVKTLIFIVASPLIGFILGFIFMVAVYWIFRHTAVSRVDKGFRFGQLFSAAAYSIGHGGNDAQKTMGVIAAALAAGGFLEYGAGGSLPTIPLWVVLAAQAAIAFGTLSGGWRIVKTMGSKITKLKPVQGFCAELSGAITLFGATLSGIPVSTTHTITGAIVGAGSARRFSAVKWGVARRIVWAWVLTIPMAAGIAALSYWIIRGIAYTFSG